MNITDTVTRERSGEGTVRRPNGSSNRCRALPRASTWCAEAVRQAAAAGTACDRIAAATNQRLVASTGPMHVRLSTLNLRSLWLLLSEFILQCSHLVFTEASRRPNFAKRVCESSQESDNVAAAPRTLTAPPFGARIFCSHSRARGAAAHAGTPQEVHRLSQWVG